LKSEKKTTLAGNKKGERVAGGSENNF